MTKMLDISIVLREMPIGHNKDKSENPCGATGWRFVLILFPLKSGLKMGSTGGGDKQSCT